MRIVIIGGVAAGTAAAAKARRNNEEAEIIVYDKDEDISYSGCGIPYFIGGELKDGAQLTPRGPEFFKEKYNIEVKTRHEVLAADGKTKSLQIKDLSTGREYEDTYDKLIFATGARSVMPPIIGAELEQVFTLRNIRDMYRIKSFLDERHPKEGVIVGSGFIGLEVCESLKALGLKVTLVERLPSVTPGLDVDMATYVEEYLEAKEVKVYKGVSAKEITGTAVILEDGTEIPADFVLLSTGVRPNTEVAAAMGVELGETKAIKVNRQMMTNLPDVYACGDCIEVPHLLTEKPVYRPLGTTANKTGRIAGEVVTGGDLSYRGVLGTGIFRLFEKTIGLTGLSEKEAEKAGYEVVVCHNIKPNKVNYLGGEEMIIKGVADRKSKRLLGVQIFGGEGVDKRLDVFVTAISFKATVDDLFHLDLAYSPPYSTVKDPVAYTGQILEGEINKEQE
ncbi:FAD-dependent oxidoreductase [Ohessyouella blattaphilus]|uniref:FAD-dependent oxidoreductase n=1 Tax=Ohessyouella blattaphilus TaxID=2949333 RepID=A0ABT1EK11_9FIRM|nr:FAD-dependent oxidoreductase [Ohessyouella blattaphilus]MCP1109637.1 FAD-dependent oxidoreductase [Ohessyouella blattaphilus]MCR8563031.1 FAD-dependent oxidoreductase [Ohessyouella blattaphilus]